MRLPLWSASFLLQTCCALVWAGLNSPSERQQPDLPLIQGASIISSQARAARIAEFVSSHKIPDDMQRKDARLFERDDEDEKEDQKNPEEAHVGLENFGSTGLIHEEAMPIRRSSGQQHRQYTTGGQDELLSGVRISSENPTTMLPILTTQRDTRPFDFVPVNIIREDAKGNPFVPFDNRNFEDLGDVSLVPAGSNTRIQVKKGPNGKDYEYEYVYYYYDEEDEGKAGGGATASNSQEAPTRTSAPTPGPANSRRGAGGSRNKYSSLERSSTTTTTTTVEPVINEVIPSGNGNRARQLEASHEEVSEERLPTNTRFPPRSRANHAAETTERTSRVRGSRPRPALDAVDSSSFRGHLEGPEFPQNLPNGPVRFLGVTPNEGNEEKATSRGRGRPQRIQEPAPVQESDEEPVYTRRRPVAAQYESGEQPSERGQFRQQTFLSRDDEVSKSSPRSLPDERDSYTDSVTDVTDSPTTQVPHAMDKVALDLYAFLQQGRSNLVDFVKEAEEGESTESTGDGPTTELPATLADGTTLSATELDEATSTTPAPTTTPSTTTTTTTTTTTMTTTAAPPTTSEEPGLFGRNKFRRPGLGGAAASRNRFKSSGSQTGATSSTEASPNETGPTQRARGRFGAGAGAGGFKRARPAVHKQQQPAPVAEEALQKESAEKLSVELKPVAGRGRYRGTSARSGPQPRTTPAPAGDKGDKAQEKPEKPEKLTGATGGPVAAHRPGFNKLGGLNRRRGSRPGGPATPVASGDDATAAGEQTTSSASPEKSSANEQQRPVAKLPTAGARPKPLNKPIIKPGAGRLNLRPRPGQQTSTTTTEAAAGEGAPVAEGTPEEPASEGTEEETREAPAESSPPAKPTTVNPLNKLRNRNRIQVHPKTTTARTPLPPAARRSPLLPRRKTTETPVESEPSATSSNNGSSSPEGQAELSSSEEAEATEAQATETSTTASTKHEETRGLSSLLAPRRRIAPRRPGQPIAAASE